MNKSQHQDKYNELQYQIEDLTSKIEFYEKELMELENEKDQLQQNSRKINQNLLVSQSEIKK